MLGLLDGVQVNPNGLDNVHCALNSDGSFFVKALMDRAYSSNYIRSLSPLVVDFIWRKRAPPRSTIHDFS